ncbi:uncharacterized protein LOC113293277 [Papaver somniferum]|uniref:uncharacterized protein LOC113293277 n=1 Tax=Papaver somniferum TaxID=3469 RepID=UPI000E6F8573|nr:uncharacterized protein LOC113293277 [Papaver somniferum]
MCFLFICSGEEKILGRQQAPGLCPYCGGKVQSMDVEVQWRFFCLPLCFKTKRRFFCTNCSKRLEMYPSS